MSNRERASSLSSKSTVFSEPAYTLATKAIHAGVMLKQSKKIGMVWRKRFCILNTDFVLYYFNAPTDKETLSSIPLKDIQKIEESNKPRKHGLLIILEGRTYFFACETEEDRTNWMNILQQAKAVMNTKGATIPKKGETLSSSATSISTPSPTLPHSPSALSIVPPKSSPLGHQRTSSSPNVLSGTKRSEMARAFSLNVSQDVSKDLKQRMEPWIEWSMEMMRVGAVVHKYPYLGLCSGQAKRRYIQLTEDQAEIRWGCERAPDDYAALNRSIPVNSIEKVIYGPYTLTWAKFFPKVKGKWRCLSFVINVKSKKEGKQVKRTIDLQFGNESECLGFLIGLSHLIQKEKHTMQGNLELNMVMSSYKWTKLKLQLMEKADSKEKSIGKLIGSAVQAHYS